MECICPFFSFSAITSMHFCFFTPRFCFGHATARVSGLFVLGVSFQPWRFSTVHFGRFGHAVTLFQTQDKPHTWTTNFIVEECTACSSESIVFCKGRTRRYCTQCTLDNVIYRHCPGCALFTGLSGSVMSMFFTIDPLCIGHGSRYVLLFVSMWYVSSCGVFARQCVMGIFGCVTIIFRR